MIDFDPSWLYHKRGGVRYLLAAFIVGTAPVITWGLKQLFPATPNALYFCAIILSAWYGGIGPGIFASILATLAIRFTPHVTTTAEASRYITFLLVGVFTSWLIERQRRSQAALQQVREELEEKVCERTGELTATNEGLKSEITSRKRTEALLDCQRRVLEMMATGAPLTESLAALVRLIEANTPDMLGSILLIDEPGGRLRHGAAPSLPADYVKAIDGEAIGPKVGSCGTAAFRKEAVFVEDIATDPLWESYRAAAMPHGLRACWSTPIFDPEHRVLGTFAMYYRRPALPTAEDLQLIEIATHIAALAICREKAQTILRESEAKLKEAERLANIGYWERNLIADSITWSEETCRIFGVQMPQGRFGQAELEQLIHPDDRKHQREALAKVLHGWSKYDVEYRIVRPDGEVRFIHVRDDIVCDESGRPLRVFGTVQDITKRKRAEALLHAQAQEIRTIVENSPDLIVRWNLELRRTYVNTAFIKATGVSREALLGRKLGSTVEDGIGHATTDDIAALRKSIEWVRENRRPLEFEHSWPLPSGRRRYVVQLEPEFDTHGRLTSILGISRDITERKLADQAVRESQQLLNLVLATLPVGVTVTNQAGDIVLVNAASKRIWGDMIISGRERWAQSKGFWHDSGKRIDPENWASVRALSEGQITLNELIDIETYDGQRKTIQNSSAPIRNAEGLIMGALIVNEDVTERVRAEEALRQTQADLTRVVRLTTVGELTASIAHEVNQPLAAVVTNANASLRWLAATPPNLHEVREAVLRIIRDGNRASDVVTRIRTLLKKGEPIRTPLDINELIHETVALTRPELARRKVSLQTELAPELPRVKADRVQLQQVLLNLVFNALDSLSAVAGRPRVLRILTNQGESEAVRVAVQDTGVGIDQEQSERLFQAFFTTKPHGLGMGLAISRSIIEAHGGRLWMIPNDGPGVTFHFALPTQNGGAK